MSEKEQDPFSASAEFSGYVNNDLSEKNDNIWEHSGLIPNEDKNSLELMNFLASSYDPSMHPEAPHMFGNTFIGTKLKKNLASKVGNQAIKDGNISQMKRIVGKQSYGYDASSIHALRALRNRMDKDAYIAYLFGHMGHGKSEFAFLCGEIAKEELGYDVYSNVRSVYEEGCTDGYIYTFGELLKTLAGGEEIDDVNDIQKDGIDVSDQKLLFIFDEGNQKASGYSNDAYEAMEKLGKLITLIRKVGGILIIIGHTGKDVHPHIRRLSNDCIKKESKKKAQFYHAVNDNGDGVGHKEDITGIPKTNWNYDTLEISFWDWTLACQNELDSVTQSSLANNKSERNMAIFEDYHTTDMTQEQIADDYDLERSRISQILKEMEEKVSAFKDAKANGGVA